MEVTYYEESMNNQNLDVLSKLHDDLLINILSRLESKEVVQTCILSKRWRNMWAYVPSLNFDFAKFRGELRAERFNNVVSAFLRNRDGSSKVHSFKLCYSKSSQTDETLGLIKRWILYATQHGVKNLVIDVWSLWADLLKIAPAWMLTCDTIEYMHLNSVTIKCHFACLANLRFLSLHCMKIFSLQELVSGCPMLDTLSLYYAQVQIDNISFPTLKSLNLEGCLFDTCLGSTFSISAPCLKFLKYVRCRGGEITFKDMPRLTEAIITQHDDLTCYHKFNILSGIIGSEYLELTILYWKEFFNTELENGMVFNSLKNLVLTFYWKNCNFGILSSFLKHCPNLKRLRLLQIEPCSEIHKKHEKDNLEATQEIEGCTCKHLKLVEIVPNIYCHCKCRYWMKKFLLQWTKRISGVQIIISQNKS